MMLRFACNWCDGGKAETSRHGGNDPDTWEVACEECDGQGNDEVDDEGLIPVGQLVTQCPQAFVYSGPGTQWTAYHGGCVGKGVTEGGAVRALIEKLDAIADEAAFEGQMERN